MSNHVDEQYLRLLDGIINEGVWKETRSGKVLSVFDKTMRFNLQDGLPILTTKKVYLKGIIYELLWFLRGDTNIKYLVDNNVHIWDDDAYRFYLDKTEWIKQNEGYKQLSKDEFVNFIKNNDIDKEKIYDGFRFGDLGEIYGKQWRNYGVSNKDQISDIINKLKTNPNDRRMVLTGWNADVIDKIALPACHMFAVFYTKSLTYDDKKTLQYNKSLKECELTNTPSHKLSCSFTCRSQDVFLGTPFNITSYALLTCMIAQCVNMMPDELIWHGMDCHIYEGHMDAVKEELSRDPYRYDLPTLQLNEKITNMDDFTYEDINVINYESYQSIKAPLSVGI